MRTTTFAAAKDDYLDPKICVAGFAVTPYWQTAANPAA